MDNLISLERLKTKLEPKINDYISDDYEGIAFHSSSIIFLVNYAIADMFGYAEDEFFGMNAWRLFSTDSVKKIMQHLLEKSEESYQVKGVKKDKTQFDVELKGVDFELSGDPVRAVMLRRLS